MKIDDLIRQQAIQGTTEAKKQDAAKSGEDFAALLQSEITGSQLGAEASPISGTGSISSILSIDPMSENEQLSGPISAIEDTLTQLDSLGEALQGNKSPREIDAIINRVNSEAAGLDGKLSGLPGDHPLKDVAEEVKIASYVETVKWKRGDYL